MARGGSERPFRARQELDFLLMGNREPREDKGSKSCSPDLPFSKTPSFLLPSSVFPFLLPPSFPPFFLSFLCLNRCLQSCLFHRILSNPGPWSQPQSKLSGDCQPFSWGANPYWPPRQGALAAAQCLSEAQYGFGIADTVSFFLILMSHQFHFFPGLSWMGILRPCQIHKASFPLAHSYPVFWEASSNGLDKRSIQGAGRPESQLRFQILKLKWVYWKVVFPLLLALVGCNAEFLGAHLDLPTHRSMQENDQPVSHEVTDSSLNPDRDSNSPCHPSNTTHCSRQNKWPPKMSTS